MNFTYIIIGITAIISFMGFSNNALQERLMFWPYRVVKNNEYYRFFTNTLVHGGQQHLIFNMITLFFFGPILEGYFVSKFGATNGILFYVLFYLLGSFVADIPAYIKHKNNNFYRSVGASGAISAVLFAAIMIRPMMMINFIIPAFIFGPLYLGYSLYMDRQNKGNVAHDAHFAGAIFGLIGIVLFIPETFPNFLEQIIGRFS